MKRTILMAVSAAFLFASLNNGVPAKPGPAREVGTSADYCGAWSGETSQGHPIWLEVKDVDGSQTVTRVKFNITARGPGYGMTKKMYQPKEISAVIDDQRFRAEWAEGGSSHAVSGSFESATLVKGTVRIEHVHPQGYGAATGEASFTAEKETTQRQ